MTQNLITPKLLVRHMRLGFYGPFMAPFFAVHLKYAHRGGRTWAWADERAVQECLTSTWDMLAKWQALRAVRVDRHRFHDEAAAPVTRLARVLNRAEIRSLGDIGACRGPTYERVLEAIHEAVMEVSSLKGTQTPEPMFGSKVLHHYFPSVVPVFDRAMVRNGAMRIRAFHDFLGAHADSALVLQDAAAAGGSAALDYHRFVAFCTAQIAAAPKRLLHATRRALAAGVADFAPHAVVSDRQSYIWHLDAKVAEFCACGQAAVEGFR